ncbi:Na+/H+ antiporter [Nakamurella sp.]|uniref:Na+/H+ antiporter n=1 Tax=Nakamurella sp. TaxID=1869182 RepID=UPI003B3AE706
MPDIGPVVLLVLGVVAVNGLAGRIRVPAPILLVIVGVAVSFVPGMPAVQVDPELVLTVLIPPLLYAAATESSVVAIRTMLRSIFQLAVGMVLVTAFAVATVLYLLVPGIPFAAGLALGAIVAPPDAVAAVAVARRAGLPRRVVTVLEGESLFNDATSLVLLRVALVGLAVGSMSWGDAVLEFGWATAGGLLIGGAVGWLLSWGRRLSGSALATTAVSLVAPFVAYQLGERAEASGVLAVVTTGLVLGFRAPYDLAPEVRLTLRATWSTIQYVLEGTVFALIGLQLWAIVTAPDIGRRPVVLISGAVLLTVILIRPLWIFLLNGLARLLRRSGAFADWRPLAAVSWAGMRGVVSLAAAQTLPLDTPYRPLLLTCTIVVILGTLVVQGLSLPRVIRWLHFPGDPAAEIDAERMAARDEANRAIADAVESDIARRQLPEDQARRMRLWVETRDWRRLAERRSTTIDETGRVLGGMADWNREMMRIERDVFVQLRNSGRLSEEVMREVEYGLDLEEALLDQRTEAMSGHLDQLRGQSDDDPNGASPT